jgi:monoterpene epsilon-lactone hydrolase
MPKTVSQGRPGHVFRSWSVLLGVSMSTFLRRLFHGPLAPGWSANFEIGNLFWREQFNHAFAMSDIQEARRYFDSLMTWTDEVFEVDRTASSSGAPVGDWITPPTLTSGATLLYLHGGGYTFYSDVSRRFADSLASLLGVRVFAPDYRLTPEHPHPAQCEDALAAYRYLLSTGVDPSKLVVLGDSAGGHLTLMLLVALQGAGLPQPALAVGLCPWTDIGERGLSLQDNNRYDLVQGYMAVRFGEWLVGATHHTREELSPIHQDYRGLAPLYLQGGGREVLIDMIRDFAGVVADQGCDVTLDVWPEMTHNFHAHGLTRPESAEAICRIRAAISYYVEGRPAAMPFEPCVVTETRCAGPANELETSNGPKLA